MSPFAITVMTAVASSAIWPALLPKLIEWKNRKQEEDRQRTEAERDRWFKESTRAYNRVRRECTECTERLEAMDDRWYTLLDSLEEVCAASGDGAITVAEVRSVVRKARQHEQQQRATSGVRRRADDEE